MTYEVQSRNMYMDTKYHFIHERVDNLKACCITGCEKIPAEKLDHVRRELRREITRAIEEGYTFFISGFESDADLEFAAIVAEIKKENPAIYLEAALSHPGLTKSKDERFRELIKEANGVMPVSPEESPDSSFARNRYLVKQSQLVIAVFDGDGETDAGQTIRMSAAEPRDLRIIEIGE